MNYNLLLDVRNLRTVFYTSDGVAPAVDGVTFSMKKGESLGIVGESGCGKSITALSLMRLLPSPSGKIEDGQILFEGEDILKKSETAMRKIRGKKISMIFQEPMTSLNPVLTIGRQVSEALEERQKLWQRYNMGKPIEWLKKVGISLPERRVLEYPHQMSGGMRQRIMIAMAISSNPRLLIADEPTTALDVTIQAQILELMKNLKREFGMAILMITHDFGVIAEMTERVLVMYAGKIVEEARVEEILQDPKHPYTIGLLASIPRIDEKKRRLHVIEGSVPNPSDFLTGCAFQPRCKYAQEICLKHQPPLRALNGTRHLSCWIGTSEYSEEAQL